jgi:hypothetical protein
MPDLSVRAREELELDPDPPDPPGFELISPSP